MDNTTRLRRYRWMNQFIRGACCCLVLAIGTTWLGATYDFPVDAGVVTGMNAPECAPVRDLLAGSLLADALPDSDICRSFFLYRTSFPNAADDAASYRTWVMHERVGEFWQLIGYVLALWFIAMCGIAFAIVVVRRLVRRLRRVRSSNLGAKPSAPVGHPRGGL